MRGIKLYNFPAFDRAERELKSRGRGVVNPAQIDRKAGFNPTSLPVGHDWEQVPDELRLRDIIKRDLLALVHCDCIYMIKGWGESKGALAELAVARWMGLKCEAAPDAEPLGGATGRTILQEAQELTRGARQADYGHPYDDYKRVTGAFNAVTGHNLKPSEGGVFMACVKLARQGHRPKRDNMVDLAGYADCIYRIAEKEAEGGEALPSKKKTSIRG
jgi:hypothetical protein